MTDPIGNPELQYRHDVDGRIEDVTAAFKLGVTLPDFHKGVADGSLPPPITGTKFWSLQAIESIIRTRNVARP